MAKIELRNRSGHVFIDVSMELYREYEFESGRVFAIDHPQWLSVSKTGHRVLAADGKSYFIPFGWIALKWVSAEGSPHFVK